MGSPRGQPQGSSSTRRGLHPPLPVQTQLDQVTNCHMLLCKSPQEPLLVGSIASAYEQKAVEPVATQKSLGFYNRLFLVPKSNNRWRPILDLRTLNMFLNTKSFKMETSETIRTSLQAGEWVTSIDFKDAYFHIPIHNQSRKYMCFHVQGQSYQFKALPFGLSTAPMEFTVVAKEVNLMALQRGIRIHQYLDDWLVRARSHHTCLQPTQTLVALCQLGWLVNTEKSELDPKQVFNFVGYQFDLKEGKVKLTPERWQALTTKIQTSSRAPGLGSGCTQSVLGRPGHICLPTSSHLGQSGEVAGLPMQQDHTDCTGVAQHALVLGPSGHVQSDPTVPAQSAQSGDSTIQPDPTQESVKP